MPSIVSSRPLTLRRLGSARMNRSSLRKKSERRKKSPSKVNENGMVGNPAGPTVAPGGSAAAAAWLAGALPDPPPCDPLAEEPLCDPLAEEPLCDPLAEEPDPLPAEPVCDLLALD